VTLPCLVLVSVRPARFTAPKKPPPVLLQAVISLTCSIVMPVLAFSITAAILVPMRVCPAQLGEGHGLVAALRCADATYDGVVGRRGDRS